MGKYSDNLARRLRGNHTTKVQPRPNVERLESAAIERDGKIHGGHRSHYELRRSLGDPNPQTSNLADTEGFLTTTGRFVSRREAQDVAIVAEQIRSAIGRPLLSSDINW